MINKEAFNAWRTTSETKQVFEFLKHFQADMAMRWASGEMMPADAQFIAKAYGELVTLEHNDIERFYEKE